MSVTGWLWIVVLVLAVLVLAHQDGELERRILELGLRVQELERGAELTR